MTDTHLTLDEVTIIESYFHESLSVSTFQSRLRRAKQLIYSVISYFKEGYFALDYLRQYSLNKKKCGRKALVPADKEQRYILEKVAKSQTPDVIKGRAESKRSLVYRQSDYPIFETEFGTWKGTRLSINSLKVLTLR